MGWILRFQVLQTKQEHIDSTADNGKSVIPKNVESRRKNKHAHL
jgi:hypothetical protein